MSDLTPEESAALRARIVRGAAELPAGRSPSRMVAIVSAVAAVGVVAVASVSLALGLGSATEVLATPTPSSSATTTPTPRSTPTSTPTPIPTSTPTPAPTSEPAPVPVILEVGDDIVTAEQWDLLSSRGWGYYYFAAQQRYVATDPRADLPAEVTADIQRRMDAIPNNVIGESGDLTVGLTAADSLMWEVRQTGKNVVALRYNVFSVPGEQNGQGMRWHARATQEGWWMPLAKSRDELLADVNAWITANADADSWIVIVGPGEPIVP